jgi:ketosteroid isomerase-like protein
MATLAPGATILPNGLPPLTGAAAIRAFWFPECGPATTVTAMETPVDQLTADGDLAVGRGTGTLSFTLRYPDGRQQSATQRSRYVTVLQRQPDGRWLILWRAWSDLRAASR